MPAPLPPTASGTVEPEKATFSIVMSVLFLVTRGSDSMYDQIGQGGLSKESDYDGVAGAPQDAPLTSAARAEQERSEQLRTQFFANTSHELRTPLVAIRGFAALIGFFAAMPPVRTPSPGSSETRSQS